MTFSAALSIALALLLVAGSACSATGRDNAASTGAGADAVGAGGQAGAPTGGLGGAPAQGGHAGCAHVEQVVTTAEVSAIGAVVADDDMVVWVPGGGPDVLAADRVGCGFGAPRVVAHSPLPSGARSALALSQDAIVWSDGGGLWKTAKAGGDAVSLSSASTNAFVVDGGNVVFVTGVPYPAKGGELRTVPLAGGVETILQAFDLTPGSLAIDGATAIVALGWDVDARIVRVPLAGGPAVTVVPSAPRLCAIAARGGEVVWTQASSASGTDTFAGDGTLWRQTTPVNGHLGSPCAVVVVGDEALVASAGWFLAQALTGYPLLAVPLDGGPPRTLSARAGQVSISQQAIAVTSDGSVFFLRGPGGLGPGSVVRTWL